MRVRALPAAVLSATLLTPLVAAGAAAAAPGAPGITAAKAKALARAGVLKAADMPGYVAERDHMTASDLADERAFAACIGARPPKYAARNFGVTYTKGNLLISSSADVAPTVAAAKSDLKAFSSAKLPGCYRKSLVSSIEEEGAKVSSASVTVVPVTVANADGARAFRYSVVATTNGYQLRFKGLQVAARVGQTEISVHPLTVNQTAPGLRKAQSLAAIVAKRVRAGA